MAESGGSAIVDSEWRDGSDAESAPDDELPNVPEEIPTPEELLRREVVRKYRNVWIHLSRMMQESRDRSRAVPPDDAPPSDL